MPLSAAEVLAGGLAVKNAADAASVWGKPAATLKPPVKASPPPSKPRPAPTDSSSSALDSDPTASAASALLGLQKEPARMSHKQVEQHRRLKAKQYFDELRCLLPTGRDPKNDRNRVLQLAIEHLRNVESGKTPVGDSRDSDADLMVSMDADEASSVSQPKAESEADKRLSHNEVEQKRRQQARQHYDELRALLPNASKYDKNTVLLYTIQTIRQMQGVSEQDLAKMVRELPVSEDGEVQPDQAAGASTISQLASTKSQLSESPTDVVSFTTAMALMHQGDTRKASRKRTSNMMGVAATESAVKQEPDHQVDDDGKEPRQDAEVERKKLRRLSVEGTVPDIAEDGEDASAQVKQANDEGVFEAETDGLDALSLLSHCAVQLAASQPTTPQIGPRAREGSWGEVSMMRALPRLVLASPSGKESLVAAAAKAAAAAATKPSLTPQS